MVNQPWIALLQGYLNFPSGRRLEVIPLVGHVRCVKEAGGHSFTFLDRLIMAGSVHIQDKDLLHRSILVGHLCWHVHLLKLLCCWGTVVWQNIDVSLWLLIIIIVHRVISVGWLTTFGCNSDPVDSQMLGCLFFNVEAVLETVDFLLKVFLALSLLF